MKWYKPEVKPQVPVGEGSQYWLAVKAPLKEEPHVFIAEYINRPVEIDMYREEDWGLSSGC